MSQAIRHSFKHTTIRADGTTRQADNLRHEQLYKVSQ